MTCSSRRRDRRRRRRRDPHRQAGRRTRALAGGDEGGVGDEVWRHPRLQLPPERAQRAPQLPALLVGCGGGAWVEWSGCDARRRRGAAASGGAGQPPRQPSRPASSCVARTRDEGGVGDSVGLQVRLALRLGQEVLKVGLRVLGRGRGTRTQVVRACIRAGGRLQASTAAANDEARPPSRTRECMHAPTRTSTLLHSAPRRLAPHLPPPRPRQRADQGRVGEGVGLRRGARGRGGGRGGRLRSAEARPPQAGSCSSGCSGCPAPASPAGGSSPTAARLHPRAAHGFKDLHRLGRLLGLGRLREGHAAGAGARFGTCVAA